MSAAPNTIFLTGTGRSGTNILKSVFSAHGDIATLPFEYRFIIDPDGIIDFYNSYPVLWSPYRADKLIHRLESFLVRMASLDEHKEERSRQAKVVDPSGLKITPPPYSGWELEQWIPGYKQFVNDLIGALSSFKYSAVWPGTEEGIEHNEMVFQSNQTKDELRPILSSFVVKCLTAIRTKQGKQRFLEDNTHNFLFAEDLFELVPDSKMIHVVRDPRDVVSSLMTQRWAPRQIEKCTDWYKEVMQHWLDQRAKIGPERIIEIRFEDLVNRTQSTVEELCTFLNMDLDPKMLEIDLSAHHIGRHKSDLQLDQIADMNTKLSFILEEYGY